MSEPHEEIWVKVNALVDRGIAPIVTILNNVEGLRTIDSCQGIAGSSPAHVYFYYGSWQQIGRFMFEVLGPRLAEAIGNSAVASVEVFNGSLPMGKLSFDTEATNVVASVLERIVYERP